MKFFMVVNHYLVNLLKTCEDPSIKHQILPVNDFAKQILTKIFVWFCLISSNGHLEEFHKTLWNSLIKISVLTTFFPVSIWVLVSTTTKFSHLYETPSQQLENSLIWISLGLNNLELWVSCHNLNLKTLSHSFSLDDKTDLWVSIVMVSRPLTWSC